MAYNQINCQSNLLNSGIAGCGGELTYFAKPFWVKPDFEIDTEVNALLQATWEAAINLKQVYPFPLLDTITEENEEDVVESLPTGNKIFVREGKLGATGMVNLALCSLQRLRSFNNVKGKIIFVTENGYILGYSPDGVKLTGFDLQMFRVGGIGTTDGSTSRKTPIKWSLQDPAQMNDYGVAIKPTWNPLDLNGILDVTVTALAPVTSSLFNFTVTRVCDGEGVDGLVAGDFSFLNGSAVAQTAVFAEVGGGAYKYTASATIVDGTIDLKAPNLQTTGGYESSAPATCNVP